MARILVVDDDEAVTGTFVKMLQTEGHELTAVADPAAGLNLVRQQQFDAILLDMRMPGIGGLDFLRKLRAGLEGRRLPVAVVTGDYFLKDDVLKELESLGAVIKYKPLWMADLILLVQELLVSSASALPAPGSTPSGSSA